MKTLLVLVVLSLSMSELALSQTPEYLSELALFQRCYAQLTSARAKKSDALYKQVKAGQKSALTACSEVFSSAIFTADSNGRIANVNSVQAKNVVKTFHKLHSSWFSVLEFPVINTQSRNRDQRDIYDQTTSALYFTRALFHPSLQVQTAITSNEYVRANRSDNDPAAGADTGHLKSDFIFTPSIMFAPIGELLGVKSAGPQLLNYPAIKNVQKEAGSVDIHKTLGAGAIGATPYLMLNMAAMDDQEYMTDGAIKMHRRWGKAVFKDLLCREIPVVRESDVLKFVDTGSSISFRNSSACTKCHASMDRAASTIRNLKVQNIALGNGTDIGQQVRGGIYPNFHPITKAAEAAWPVEPDADYYQRPTNGTFFFRTYDGVLIDQPVTSVSDLGQKIANTDDFYICLAKRYYSYFTGINVNTGDLDDPWTPKLTAGDKVHRDIVISLGKNLRSNQSLSQLVKDILSLDNYKRIDFGSRLTGSK